MTNKITGHTLTGDDEFPDIFDFRHKGITWKVFVRADGDVFDQDGREWSRHSYSQRAFYRALDEWRQIEALRQANRAREDRALRFKALLEKKP